MRGCLNPGGSRPLDGILHRLPCRSARSAVEYRYPAFAIARYRRITQWCREHGNHGMAKICGWDSLAAPSPYHVCGIKKGSLLCIDCSRADLGRHVSVALVCFQGGHWIASCFSGFCYLYFLPFLSHTSGPLVCPWPPTSEVGKAHHSPDLTMARHPHVPMAAVSQAEFFFPSPFHSQATSLPAGYFMAARHDPPLGSQVHLAAKTPLSRNLQWYLYVSVPFSRCSPAGRGQGLADVARTVSQQADAEEGNHPLGATVDILVSQVGTIRSVTRSGLVGCARPGALTRV